jgi:hypothetical protein
MTAFGATSPLAHELAKDRFAPDLGVHLFILKDRLRIIRLAQAHCNATAVVAIARSLAIANLALGAAY